MSEVVNLQDRLKAKYAATGEAQWLICPCQLGSPQGVSGMLPLACLDAKGPVVVALVCPDCETEISLVYGRPVSE